MKPINLHITFDTHNEVIKIFKNDTIQIIISDKNMTWKDKKDNAYWYVCTEAISLVSPVRITQNWF